MLFILIIVLSIWAAFRGWNWMSVLPLVLSLATGWIFFTVGMFAEVNEIFIVLGSLGIDFVAIGTLIAMCIAGRNTELAENRSLESGMSK